MNGKRLSGPRLLVAAVAGALLPACSDITDANIRQVSLEDVRALTLRQAAEPDKRLVVFIDPRAQARFDAGHLPGARNLKLPQVSEKGGTDPDIAAYRTIVVYGTDPGNAAARAMTKRLMSVGYDRVRLYAGGIVEWLRAGYALETTPGAEPLAQPSP